MLPSPKFADAVDPVASRTRFKVGLRLLPFLFVLYIVAYLDRINISFAALQMDHSVFTEQVFGLETGIFFVGYFLFEVPSNLLLERVGARYWLARIMVSWGLISAGMMFLTAPWQFYLMRFLLGVAEAGFFPGVILYLTYWFPQSERGRAVAWFMTATSVAGVIGGPVSGALLRMDGWGGLAGWQWLFLLEGLPAVVLGVVVLYYLDDRPEVAGWLEPDERDWLVERMRRDEAARGGRHGSFLAAVRSPEVWLLCLLYFSMVVGFYGMNFNLPRIIKASGDLDDFQVGCLSAVPNLVSVVAMVLVGASSDRAGERRWHIAAGALVGAVGIALSAGALHSTWLLVASLSLALAGMRSTLGPFWALPTTLLAGTAAAGGIAFINSLGNLGGFAGPMAYAWMKDGAGDHAAGLLFLAAAQVAVAGLVLAVPPRPHAK